MASAIFAAAWANGSASQLQATEPTAAEALTELIDREISAVWESAEITPAAAASDAEFLRRVYLDLVGRIPPVSVVRQFLADSNPHKRAELVDRLLAQASHAAHMSRVFAARLAPEASQDERKNILSSMLEAWLEQQFLANTPYDQMIMGLIAAPLEEIQRQDLSRSLPAANRGPAAWMMIKDSLPENLAASTTRVFLGLRIECAQCHNHPFDHWKREEFWAFAAFFSDVSAKNSITVSRRKINNPRALGIPGTTQVVVARHLNGEEPEGKQGVSARQSLADWLVNPQNLSVARAIVNRVWAQFFGLGLVDPVDDLGERNLPSHPELLDAMARALIAQHYDLRFLMRSIVLSQAYQLSSELTDASQSDPRRFARFLPRALSPPQMLASLREARGDVQRFVKSPQGPRPVQELDNDALLGLPAESTGDYDFSIPQALLLMNGPLTNSFASIDNGSLFTAVVESPFLTHRDRVETLFLATVSRPPTDSEWDRLAFVLGGAPADEAFAKVSAKARIDLADIYWALLNSSEFVLNH